MTTERAIDREPVEEFVRRSFAAGHSVVGKVVEKPPITLEELLELQEATRNCGAANTFDAPIQAIAAEPDPNASVRRLPFDEGEVASILFAIPR